MDFDWPRPIGEQGLEQFLDPRDPTLAANGLPPETATNARAAVENAIKQAKHSGVDYTVAPFVVDCDSSASWTKKPMYDRSPCLTLSRNRGHWVMNRGRRTNANEIMRLQGMSPTFVEVCVKDGMFGKQFGDAMSVNVVERIMGRLLPAAGIARTRPFHDRWESGEAVKEIRHEDYNEDGPPDAPRISTLNCPNVFSRGKRQKGVPGARLDTVEEEPESEEQPHEKSISEEGESEKKVSIEVEGPANAAVIVAHGSFDPVHHHHHIEMMVAAKRRLGEEGFHVIKGRMAITSQTALQNKCEWALSDEERLHCIQLSSEDHEGARGWLHGDSRGIEFKSGSSYRAYV